MFRHISRQTESVRMQPVTWISPAYLSLMLSVCLRFIVVEAGHTAISHALLVNGSESKARQE